MPQDEPTPQVTPLESLHRSLGARMVPFAGYAMPLHYRAGILAEHLHCRAAAALFDVSHMGQASLHGAGAAAALERLVCGDMQGLRPDRQRYTLLMAADGGILDDLMVTRAGGQDVPRAGGGDSPRADGGDTPRAGGTNVPRAGGTNVPRAGGAMRLVVNASRREADYAVLRAHLPPDVRLEPHPDRALLALQGPQAGAVLERLAPATASLPFMATADLALDGIPCWVARSGYTGEDGFEISLPAAQAEALARRLLAEPEVAPAGLGARDSLRLEAGLCLYGQDIDETTDPISAGLAWSIGKRRKLDWDFAGGAAVRARLDAGPAMLRVGLRPQGRAPARAGTPIVSDSGSVIGRVTSGGFSPTLGVPLAMGYVARAHAVDGTPVGLVVRGQTLPAVVAPMPFVAHRYRR